MLLLERCNCSCSRLCVCVCVCVHLLYIGNRRVMSGCQLNGLLVCLLGILDYHIARERGAKKVEGRSKCGQDSKICNFGQNNSE